MFIAIASDEDYGYNFNVSSTYIMTYSTSQATATPIQSIQTNSKESTLPPMLSVTRDDINALHRLNKEHSEVLSEVYTVDSYDGLLKPQAFTSIARNRPFRTRTSVTIQEIKTGVPHGQEFNVLQKRFKTIEATKSNAQRDDAPINEADIIPISVIEDDDTPYNVSIVRYPFR
ncbi:hypothetical protein G7Y79_00001g002480 [Physcia stellaris]|nr:hypothetical protein G7Y79_00001g002480 [Physcia stellaris]